MRHASTLYKHYRLVGLVAALVWRDPKKWYH